jgi:imidazolonepropionase-like amidohydrolase
MPFGDTHMTRRGFLATAGAMAAATGISCSAAAGDAPGEENRRTLIHDVRLFDGERTTPGATVLIDGDRIADPGAGHADVEVDGAGLTLVPGLIDAHTHVVDGSLGQALRHGVTTELDMFCLPDTLAQQRRLAAERDDVADLRSAGVLATAPGGHPSHLAPGVEFDTVADADEAEAFVAHRVAEGSDYLKIVLDEGVVSGKPLPTLGPDTAAALVDAGRAAGLRTIAHAITWRDVEIALDAGVDGLAHVFSDTAPGDPATERIVRRIAEQRVFVVSTLAYFEAVGVGAANAVHVARTLRDAGVTVLAGTDATYGTPAHGSGLHRELVLLAEAGFIPEEALAAATSIPARQFGLADRGRIAPGQRADLLLVRGDPTTDITASSAIVGVWRRGARL